ELISFWNSSARRREPILFLSRLLRQHYQRTALCTLQIGFLRFPHTTETRQLGYFQIIQYLQHKKDIFGFLMYQKSLILGYFPIIKIAAVQMALIRPIRRRK